MNRKAELKVLIDSLRGRLYDKYNYYRDESLPLFISKYKEFIELEIILSEYVNEYNQLVHNKQ